MVLDVAAPFFTDVAKGVAKTTGTAGLAVFLCSTDKDLGKEDAYLDILEEQRVQGVLITPIDEHIIGGDDRLRRMRERGTNVILLDREAPHSDMCSVSVDDRLGGELALRHLLHLGHRCVAFVGAPDSDCYAGAVGALSAVGLDQGRHLHRYGAPAATVSAGRDAAARILDPRSGTRPTAVFCAGEHLALSVLQGLTNRGVRVPDDVAVVGYDDIDYATVPLSVVRRPHRRLGQTAGALLFDEVGSPETHRHRQLVLPPDLVVRASSRRP